MQRGKNVVSVTHIAYSYRIHETYSVIYQLACILVSIPVSGAGCEGAFSKLSLVKCELRSTMTDEQLSGLMLMTVEKSIEEELNMQMCVDTFALKPKKS